MSNQGTYINPASKNITNRTKDSLDKQKHYQSTFLGEVIEIDLDSRAIKYRGKNRMFGDLDEIESVAIPLLPNVTQMPIRGEIVMIFYHGISYYVTMNYNNSIKDNAGPFYYSGDTSSEMADFNKTYESNKTFNIKDKKIYTSKLNEGDVIIEGRFGNSIKFGSTTKYQNAPQNTYSKSDLSENGDPIIIIRNGPRSSAENVQKDDASIYLCSSQKIIIDNSNNGFDGITGTWSTINVNATAVATQETLNTEEVEIATEQRDRALNSSANNPGDPGSSAARERASYMNSQVTSGEAAAMPVSASDIGPIPTTVTELRRKIIAYAQQDAAIPTVETPYASNYGTRINEMLRNCGLDNQSKYNRDREGYYWCAAAVTTWYKSAGADYPTGGPASCDTWKNWAMSRGTFSTSPVPGAAVLYGTLSHAHHIGIVESVDAGGNIVTIEGNTSAGKFDRNGSGCYRKRPRANSPSIVGYVIPSKNGQITV